MEICLNILKNKSKSGRNHGREQGEILLDAIVAAFLNGIEKKVIDQKIADFIEEPLHVTVRIINPQRLGSRISANLSWRHDLADWIESFSVQY